MKLFRVILSLLLYFSISTLPAYATIKVGTVVFYPPFVLSRSTGFDIEFIQTICQGLQEECVLMPMSFNKLYSALDEGVIDIAIGGITIAPTNSMKYIYSLPYILSKGEFLVLQSNTATSVDNLRGQTVGIMKGSQDGNVFYNFLLINYPDQFKIQTYDDMEDLITALSKGEITAAFAHESTALYWELNGGAQFKILGTPTLVGNGIGIMSVQQNASLINKINEQIKTIEKGSIYMSLYNTYFPNER